jgi:hypothetical protein
MREKPIIFSTPMVQAILAGRKTQTRRVIKIDDAPENWKISIAGTSIVRTEPYDVKLPRYAAGDVLWVRESWCENRGKYFYKADNICNGCTEDGICLPEGVAKHITCELCEDRDGYIKWRSPRFMPKEAARIFLLVTNVRVERVQDITEEDAIAEGVLWERARKINQLETSDSIYDNAKALFMRLWDSINAKRGYGWDKNPWVWVVKFERISKDEAYKKEGLKC